MAEFEVNGQTYRSDKLGGLDQFNVSRRLTPVVLSLAPLIGLGTTTEEIAAVISSDISNNIKLIEPALRAVAEMNDEDVNYVFSKTLSKVMRGVKDPTTDQVVAWSPVWTRNGLQYEDMGMIEMVQIVWRVLSEQLEGFTLGSR